MKNNFDPVAFTTSNLIKRKKALLETIEEMKQEIIDIDRTLEVFDNLKIKGEQ